MNYFVIIIIIQNSLFTLTATSRLSVWKFWLGLKLHQFNSSCIIFIWITDIDTEPGRTDIDETKESIVAFTSEIVTITKPLKGILEIEIIHLLGVLALSRRHTYFVTKCWITHKYYLLKSERIYVVLFGYTFELCIFFERCALEHLFQH